MTSNQIIHMSRVRGALREIGMDFDPKVAVHDLEYLHQALVSAIEHPNSDVQESALCSVQCGFCATSTEKHAFGCTDCRHTRIYL
jgi:hypothetical protein